MHLLARFKWGQILFVLVLLELLSNSAVNFAQYIRIKFELSFLSLRFCFQRYQSPLEFLEKVFYLLFLLFLVGQLFIFLDLNSLSVLNVESLDTLVTLLINDLVRRIV